MVSKFLRIGMILKGQTPLPVIQNSKPLSKKEVGNLIFHG